MENKEQSVCGEPYWPEGTSQEIDARAKGRATGALRPVPTRLPDGDMSGAVLTILDSSGLPQLMRMAVVASRSKEDRLCVQDYLEWSQQLWLRHYWLDTVP